MATPLTQSDQSVYGSLLSPIVGVEHVAAFLDVNHYLGRARRGIAWSDEFGVLVPCVTDKPSISRPTGSKSHPLLPTRARYRRLAALGARGDVVKARTADCLDDRQLLRP